MSRSRDDASDPTPADRLTEILGYLNFSNGKPDPRFAANLSGLYASQDRFLTPAELRDELLGGLNRLRGENAAFAESEQAERVVGFVCEVAIPAYREFHTDLLGHLPDEDFRHPFLVSRFFEAALAEGLDQHDPVDGWLARVNDFIGYRPVAVLENGRACQPYAHERHRPVPLWIRDAGAAYGPYQAVIERTMAFLAETPADVLARSYFDPGLLDEFALDVRAHDHTHPVNKRTNYTFGEWDPHVIDNGGNYRRFIVRKVILDALVDWLNAGSRGGPPDEERLFDASAVLCGTILMASSISGSGPATHDSNVTLTSLLPHVARQRDAFYARLLSEATGTRSQRLHREAAATQQPFGHVRQELNMVLAGYGARQVQYRHLAWLYARLGFAGASRAQAERIPSTSARFETEIQWRLTAARQQLDRGNVALAGTLTRECRQLIKRGIECGAIVDPWNVLAFQGQFPLFASREDSVPDQRVEALIDLTEQLFDLFGQTLAAAAAKGDAAVAEQVTNEYRDAAIEWDRYATHVVEDLPSVHGSSEFESARTVAEVVAGYREAGEAAEGLTFWRKYADNLPTARAYARVVDTLMRTGDLVASRVLLVCWLGRADEIGVGNGADSLFVRFTHWIELASRASAEQGGETEPAEHSSSFLELRKFFDFVEANAESFWEVPRFLEDGELLDSDEDSWEEPVAGAFDEEDELFDAAYDDVVFRDSAEDGIDAEMMDAGGPPPTTELERISRRIEPRLRFVQTLARGWESTAIAIATAEESPADRPDSDRSEAVLHWWRRTRELQRQLVRLLREVKAFDIPEPSGDVDSNIEFDLQVQTRFYLLHAIVSTHISVGAAERSLAAAVPGFRFDEGVSKDEQRVGEVYRAVLRGDVPEVKRLLPKLVSSFAGKPLLYVPFDNGGEPRQVLDVRTRQHVLRFLMTQLPRLGLLRETWHLLRAAYRMERQTRPEGLAVTEFDRLFRTALRNSLEVVTRSSETWESGRFDDTDLVDVVADVVEVYGELWSQHSRTMRLSTVEGLVDEDLWQEVRDFVEAYGDTLFHARVLTLGNVRAILHNGIERFLAHIEEHDDPIHPNPLVQALADGDVDPDDVADHLETIYGIVVERFERFLEYNTTTTQSDYGRLFHYLLDFLRLEAEYEREAWLLVPVGVAHEVFCELDHRDAALVWEKVFEERTRDKAADFAHRLDGLEAKYAMRLPSVRDHIEERFVKSLVVNRIVALVPPAAAEARADAAAFLDDEPIADKPETWGTAFAMLLEEIEGYMTRVAGSGIDVPPWLRTLEKAVDEIDSATREPDYPFESLPTLPTTPVPLRDLRRQLKNWKDPLFKPRKPKA